MNEQIDKQNGKATWMLRVPAAVCLLSALFVQVLEVIFVHVCTDQLGKLSGDIEPWKCYLIMGPGLVLIVPAAILLFQLLPKLWKKTENQEAADDAD